METPKSAAMVGSRPTITNSVVPTAKAAIVSAHKASGIGISINLMSTPYMSAAICCENRHVWNGLLHNPHELLRMGDLAAFVGIVDDGGFAESARRRGVSASTLSRAVTRLEE